MLAVVQVTLLDMGYRLHRPNNNGHTIPSIFEHSSLYLLPWHLEQRLASEYQTLAL